MNDPTSNQEPGKFITFEGIDRSGKSTQSRLLKRNLDSLKVNALLTSEPGGSNQIGSQMRQLILDPSIERTEITAALLFSADRYEHVEKKIKPALKSGRWVISDRFADSTIAYQGGGGQVDMELLRYLANVSTAGLEPDLTILLDLEVEKRTKRNPKFDYYDRGNMDFDVEVLEKFKQLAKENPTRFVIIEADQDIQVIATQIFSLVKKRFFN